MLRQTGPAGRVPQQQLLRTHSQADSEQQGQTLRPPKHVSINWPICHSYVLFFFLTSRLLTFLKNLLEQLAMGRAYSLTSRGIICV